MALQIKIRDWCSNSIQASCLIGTRYTQYSMRVTTKSPSFKYWCIESEEWGVAGAECEYQEYHRDQWSITALTVTPIKITSKLKLHFPFLPILTQSQTASLGKTRLNTLNKVWNVYNFDIKDSGLIGMIDPVESSPDKVNMRWWYQEQAVSSECIQTLIFTPKIEASQFW